MLLASLASLAFADSITLDTGATIEGDLARYEYGGSCQLSVTEGELTGVILIVPCNRVQSFVRTEVRTPVPVGLEEEARKRGLDGGAAVVEAADPASASAPTPAAVPAPSTSGQASEVAAAPVGEAEPVEAVASEPESSGALVEEPLLEPMFSPSAPSAPPVAPARPAAAPPPPAPAAEPTGPHLAPRMDEPEAEHHPVSF